ncbi:hypothetical protein ACSSV8_003994 [Roseovarius sp. MBR-79]
MRRAIILAIVAMALQGCVLPIIGSGKGVAERDVLPPRPVEPLLFTSADGTVCNAVRTSPDTAATAAHCLEATEPFFLTGSNTTEPVLGARANPAYARLDTTVGAAADLAVLRLPSDGAGRVVITMIRPGPVVIAARDPSGRTQTKRCDYLGRAGGLVELACAIPLGWSGSPVIQDGRLVGIVSSKGRGDTSEITQMADAMRIDSF